MTPPSDTPRSGRGERGYNLDTLFEALKIAPDAESAKAIEERIWALWVVSGSDTCNLLMGRVKAATDEKDYGLAIKLLDAVIELKPNYTEAWNRRATLHFLQKDYGQALTDIREVLAREPRHFGAWSGLGLILQEFGDDKHALEAYRRALAINPHLEHIDEVVKTLREKVEGRDIDRGFSLPGIAVRRTPPLARHGSGQERSKESIDATALFQRAQILGCYRCGAGPSRAAGRCLASSWPADVIRSRAMQFGRESNWTDRFGSSVIRGGRKSEIFMYGDMIGYGSNRECSSFRNCCGAIGPSATSLDVRCLAAIGGKADER